MTVKVIVTDMDGTFLDDVVILTLHQLTLPTTHVVKLLMC